MWKKKKKKGKVADLILNRFQKKYFQDHRDTMSALKTCQ